MIITVSSLKGGVGKTTLGVFLAWAFSRLGKHVLAVDLDHNNNSTDYWLRGAPAELIEGRGIYQVLTRVMGLEAAIWDAGNLASKGVDMIPATIRLAMAGKVLALDSNPMATSSAIMRFRSGLRKLEYDVIILDTPPSLGLELTLGLYAADLVLVPISANRWTIQGYQIIDGEAAKVAEEGLAAPRVLAVPSMVTESEAMALQDADAWTATGTAILRDAAIKGAVNAGRELKEGTRAAGWFEALAGEVAHG